MIRVRTRSRVVGVGGDGRLDQVELADATNVRHHLDAAGLFVFIGAQPRTSWLGEQVGTDDRGSYSPVGT